MWIYVRKDKDWIQHGLVTQPFSLCYIARRFKENMKQVIGEKTN